MKGAEAASRVSSAKYAEAGARIDEQDPANLKQGEDVEVWPIDSGFRLRDRGLLVGINEVEIVLQLHSNTKEQNIRLHFPRTNFRIKAMEVSGPKL